MSGPEIITWLAGTVFDLALPEVLRNVMERRARQSRDILADELGKAKIAVSDVAARDEAAAMVFEYVEAAKRGAARCNLRLMAQVMAGKLGAPSVNASEFLRWSRVLSELTREEIMMLARFHAGMERLPAKTTPQMVFVEVQKEMIESGICKDQNDFLAILQPLTRTGLLILYPVGNMYMPTSHLNELAALARFEDVLAEN